MANGEDVSVVQIGTRVARALFDLEAPEVQDLPTTPELRAQLRGDYYVGCTSHGIDEDGANLVLIPPIGARRRLLYQGGLAFVPADDAEVRLTFELEKERVVDFVLVEHGVSVTAKRMY